MVRKEMKLDEMDWTKTDVLPERMSRIGTRCAAALKNMFHFSLLCLQCLQFQEFRVSRT